MSPLIFDKNDSRLDGGAGDDTLIIKGGDDFTINDSVIKKIETMDFDNNKKNKITLDIRDVVRIADDNQLTFEGDAKDELTLTNGAVDNGQTLIDGITYNHYTTSNGNADLFVDVDVDVSIV